MLSPYCTISGVTKIFFTANILGELAGILGALSLPIIKSQMNVDFNDMYAFPFILVVSLIASFVGSLMSEPTDIEVLKKFYKDVRPWGFWQPIHQACQEDDSEIQANKDAVRDLTNCGVGIIWQLMLVTIPLYVLFRSFTGIIVSCLILVSTTLFLKKFWYDNLLREEAMLKAEKTG